MSYPRRHISYTISSYQDTVPKIIDTKVKDIAHPYLPYLHQVATTARVISFIFYDLLFIYLLLLNAEKSLH